MSQARAQRREYELYLKKNKPEEYAKWKADTPERAKTLQQAHLENVRVVRSDFFEKKQADMIRSFREAGRSDEWIDAYIAEWVEGIKEL